ncbi:MAG: LAGLIDADG family homing endonuclease [Anaerolineae bacterium]
MSKIIATAAIRGAHYYVSEAEKQLHQAIETHGPEEKISYPNTAYYLPLILAFLGLKVETLQDCETALAEAKKLLPPPPADQLWLPYLGDALDAGIATLIAEEIIEALKYLDPDYEPEPPFIGFTDDAILRTQGIKLVDGRMPGFAACVGALPTNQEAVELAREFQEKNILVFMAGSANGRSMAEQLDEEGIEMGWDTYLVPYGKEVSAAVHALNFAARSAMTFGGIKPGDFEAARKILLYNKERVFAFVLALSTDPGVPKEQLLSDQKYATAAGAINFGFPVIADSAIPEILPRGICTYEHVAADVPRDKIVSKAIEVRGLKLKVAKIPIPIVYGAAFEGERVRKENLYVQFGSKYSTTFEYLRGRPMDEVEDGKVTLIGPDIDQAEEGGAMSLGVIVEVAGRNFTEDFETVLERRIHKFVSCASGLMHIGQRDIPWYRIGKEAYQKGFRLNHLGELLVHKFKDEFGGIVDKVQVAIITDEEKMQEPLNEARQVYHERDERMAGMKDEDVDLYYSCILCQSYAPDHVCVVTPQRLGLCGAYTWLDCKASQEMDPRGPNQPIPKGAQLDPVLGIWQGVNAYVQNASNGNVERVTMYSIMQEPQTSCVVGEMELIIDGVPTPIGEFIEKHRGDERYRHSAALTLREGKARPEPLVALQRFDAPEELIRVETKSGAQLILTKDHELAVDRVDGIQWVRADQIKPSERLIALKRLSLPGQLPAVLDLLPEDFRVSDPGLLSELSSRLRDRFGSLVKALAQLGLRPYRHSITLRDLRAIASALDLDWATLRKRIKTVQVGSSRMQLPEVLSSELFYLLGLIASDGCITPRGRHERIIHFVNTDLELGQQFAEIYARLFPDRYLARQVKAGKPTVLQDRTITSTKPCFQYSGNNPLLGVLAECFGVRDGQGRWELGRLVSLPEAHIAAFLAGVFDGDGSVRLRRYAGKWDVAEGYLCISDERAARHLQLLLRRLGIVGNLQKSGSVWKIVMYGANLRRFAEVIPARHPEKQAVLVAIRQLSSNGKLDKTQEEVLPHYVGQALAQLPASRAVLSPSTLYYYKSGRSRPVAANVKRVLEAAPEAEPLRAALETDYFLDAVTAVETVNNTGKERYEYVYNTTLADIHCYFANNILIKNCGCFECIVAVLPETNGVMVVNREYLGMTPIGMTFSTMAGEVGGGVQIPGFLGVGRMYLVSEKFISAEDGIRRVVWMPQELKDEMRDRFEQRLQEIGEPDLLDRIATENDAITVEELLEFLQEVGHPALAMESILG